MDCKLGSYFRDVKTWRVGVGKVHLRIDGEEPVLQTGKLKFRDPGGRGQNHRANMRQSWVLEILPESTVSPEV